MCVHVRVCTSRNDVLLGVRASDAIVQYLAELPTGLHWLREKMGRWIGLSEKNARVHVPELLNSIGNALHMALRCTLHAEIRMHHVDLLCGVPQAELYRRPPLLVAAFVLACHDRCRELQKNTD